MIVLIGMIVCGGAGSRLGALGAVVQKALLPVRGKPAVLGCVETLEFLGCEEVWLLAGHLSHQVKEYFALETTQARVTVLDTSTLSTSDAVRGVLDETSVSTFWYSHGDIGLGDVARRVLREAQDAQADPRAGIIAITHADKAPTHPHASLVEDRLVRIGPASDCEVCCVGIGRFHEAMLVSDPVTGPFEYALRAEAYDTIVPADIGDDWTHLEALDLYRGVK